MGRRLGSDTLEQARAREAGAEADRRVSEWESRLDSCRCDKPVPARWYLGVPACGKCGKLIDGRISLTQEQEA